MQDTRPKLSILLVNWNTREMTLECLRSIYRETLTTPFEVIIVDNASADGSAEAIAREFPQVRLLAETVNHGFGRATNIQAEVALGEKLLLLNTDTVVLDRAIDHLMAFSHHNPAAKIWGGRTLFGDRTLNPTSCWGRLTPWNQFSQAAGLSALFPNSPLFNPRSYPGWKRDSEREVDIVTGCLLMIERDFWRTLGGFDSRFFMYGEETDLCLRARRIGARPMICPAATIVHYGGGSTSPGADKIVRISAAHISLMDKHFSRLGRWIGHLSIAGGVALRAAAFTVGALIAPGRCAAKGKTWRNAWQRRAEWVRGFQ